LSLRVPKLAESQSYCVLIAGLAIAAAPSIFDRANFCQIDTNIFYVRHAQHVKHLKDAQASVRFVSFEPLLGSVGKIDLNGIDWAIVGGESGPHSRPMEEEWVVEIRDQCRSDKVAFFFKQWGGVRPKSGGRLLQGREWNQYPKAYRDVRLEAAE